MIRIKLEYFQSLANPKEFGVTCSLKNRDYRQKIIVVNDPLSQVVQYEIYDSVGNLVLPKNRNVEKLCQYSTIHLEHEETGPVGEWGFNFERYIGHTDTHYWELEKYKGQSITISASYKVGEELASKVAHSYHKNILVADERSRPIILALP